MTDRRVRAQPVRGSGVRVRPGPWSVNLRQGLALALVGGIAAGAIRRRDHGATWLSGRLPEPAWESGQDP